MPEVRKTARPASERRSSGSSERISRQLAVTLTAITSSQTFGSRWASGVIAPSSPALPRSMSSLPQRENIAAPEPVDGGKILEVERHQRRRAALRPDLVVELLERADRPCHRDDVRSRLGEG